MQTESSFSSKTLLIILALAVVVSLIGVYAGTSFLGWRQKQANSAKLEGLDKGEGSKLRAGESIPEIPLIALDGTTSSTSLLSADTDVLLFFVAINCEPCTEAVTSWYPLADQIPPNITTYAICQDDVEYARVYADKTEMIFPVFCDTARTFDRQFDVNIYPTVIGVRKGGTIAFIKHGFDTSFDPVTASTMLMSAAE